MNPDDLISVSDVINRIERVDPRLHQGCSRWIHGYTKVTPRMYKRQVEHSASIPHRMCKLNSGQVSLRHSISSSTLFMHFFSRDLLGSHFSKNINSYFYSILLSFVAHRSVQFYFNTTITIFIIITTIFIVIIIIII